MNKPDTLAVGEGIVMPIAPSGVPVDFDREAVGPVIGELSGCGRNDS
jgi:hypothetical protein